MNLLGIAGLRILEAAAGIDDAAVNRPKEECPPISTSFGDDLSNLVTHSRGLVDITECFSFGTLNFRPNRGPRCFTLPAYPTGLS